jgi:hypothetical protein
MDRNSKIFQNASQEKVICSQDKIRMKFYFSTGEGIKRYMDENHQNLAENKPGTDEKNILQSLSNCTSLVRQK